MHVLAIAVLSTAASGPLVAADINSFSQIETAGVKVNADVPGDLYCGCKIDWQDKKGVIDLESCGYRVRKNEDHTSRVGWEHVAPAWQFDHQHQCRQEGGRQNRVKNSEHRKMESNTRNLQPAVGEVSDDRGNFMYSQWNGDEGQCGQCTIEVDFKDKVAKPPTHVRGAVACTYFYMRDRYQLNLSHQQTQLFTTWDKQYPVTVRECERGKRIMKVQGNHNPYVRQVYQAQKS